MISDRELNAIKARASRVLSNGTTSGSARALAGDALRLVQHLENARKPRRKRAHTQTIIDQLEQQFEED